MNPAFRALLIGVPAYRDDAIDDLPFITDDIAELEVALSSAGYLVAVHDVKETDRDSIDSAVEEFFQDAAPGDTLLLYLSGHGVHHNGVDYLVPKGALTRSHDFRSRCLSLDFSTYVERSRAGDVAVFVDACREGIVLKEMAAVNAAGWSDMQVDRAGARHYCHVYACSPGERARYTTAGNSTFSIFSRALSSVVIDEGGPRTLGELKEQLQMAADALTAEHNLPRQQIRVRTETETDEFALFDRPDRDEAGGAGEHAWVAAVRDHPAWKQIGDGPGAAEGMKEAAISIIAHVAGHADHDEARLQSDSWRPIGFAERMTGRMGWLLSKVLNPEKLALSPAEAALLVVTPFLYEACANRAAAEMLGVEPTNLSASACPSPERANYEQFFSTRPRLVRRASTSGKAEVTHDIAWWIFRRWLARKPGDFHEQVLQGLLGPLECMSENVPIGDRKLVAELFELDTLSALMRALRTSFDMATIRPERQLAGSTEAEQRIREQLLIVLLIVAHHLAIDPVLLPDVVVDHLDISYSVNMAELHRTIQTAVWHPRGRTRVLNAACRHPAVGLALRQQAALLDSVLGSVDVQAGSEPQLAPLQDLPVHATADQVRPAADAQGRPAYESTDLRFRLADDRIQELLMGEQLYGDPALAIRELYQNALDACRYRGARTAYLRKGNAHLAEWTGRIAFVQGVDQRGRSYIECTDNGIGMGERELREVFSHAGMRFADLPEYLDEQAAWRDVGIEIHPNSRFGIGVLSYFMIADDISVTTCRLDHEGHPGHRLQVDIAGPGSLFHIRDLGRGHDAFTTVRLYLRSPADAPSCTDLLRRLLWISEYTVTATDAETQLEWVPGVLSHVAPLGAEDAHAESAKRVEDATADATSCADVWWTSTLGGVLADGVWMGVSLFGAVVNLTGPYAPQLTVDRRRALGYNASHVTDLLHREIGSLMAAGAVVLGHGWLSELAKHQPRLADAVAEAAVARGHAPWAVHGREVDITAVGCFPHDDELMGELDQPDWRYVGQRLPRFIADWRAMAWAAAGWFPGVSVASATRLPLAQPTDGRLLALQRHTRSPFADSRSAAIRQDEWMRPTQPVPLGHVLWFAELVGRRPDAVAARLAELGLRLPEGVVLPETVDRDDLLILSEDIDGQGAWLDSAAVVPLGHLLRAALRTGRRPESVAARFAELGLRLPEDVVLPATVEPDDLRILSEFSNRQGHPWLDMAAVVPLGHVLWAAEETGRRPDAVAARLVEFGLRLPEGVELPEKVDPHDVLILSRDLDRQGPWLDAAAVVPLGHVLRACSQTGLRPEAVAARLTELGLRLPEDVVLPATVDPDDLVILSEGLDREAPWLDPAAVVPVGFVLWTAGATGRSPRMVAARLRELGLRLPEDDVLPEIVDHEDVLVLSRDLDRQGPWLDAAAVVPLGHVLRACGQTGRAPRAVAARLAEFGLSTPEGVVMPEKVDPGDLLILSEGLDRESPWLDAAAVVPLGHVLRAAHQMGRDPEVVAERLAELGMRLPERAAIRRAVERDDLALLFRHAAGNADRWLGNAAPVTLWDVAQIAALSGLSLVDVAQRLNRLGLTLAQDVVYDSVEA